MYRFLVAGVATFTSLSFAQAAGFSEASCHLNGFETPVRCVSIAVPLDYDAPDGAQISVTAAVVPATTARPEGDPLIVLAGGPGQAATGMAPWLSTAFEPTRRARDIVFFDIRGTGLSGRIDCAFSLTTTADGAAQGRADAAACAGRFGPAAAFYSSREVIEDLERLRRALKYERMSLWGGSFGTRIAQHYIRKYGAHVRAAVLDGVTPVAESIFVTGPVTGQRALDLLFADCARQAACAATFPHLRENLDALLSRGERGELRFDVGDPRSGLERSGMINRDGVVGLVRGALYVSMTRALAPYAIARGAAGDVKPLLALGAATAEWSVDTMSLGSMLGIICGEDLARAKIQNPASLSFGFMRDSYYRYFAEACSAWPHRALRAAMGEALVSRVPALAISGDADPVTPPSSGEATLKQFSTRVHVVLPNAFHTNSANPCVAGIIASFLDDPVAGGRDHACAKRVAPPRFITSPNA